jgi:hypothetical protein
MAKRIFNTYNQSWTASAAGSAIAAAATYMSLTGGSATQVVDILEVAVSGLASASTIGAFQVVPASTAGTGSLTMSAIGTDGPMNTAAGALSAPVLTGNTYATTQPTPSSSSTIARLNVTINMFGGIFRWNAAPTQQLTMIGNAVNLGNFVLYNSSTGGGATGSANAHIIYEPY